MTLSRVRIRTFTVTLLLLVSLLSAVPAASAAVAADDDPILFVHGYLGSASSWSTMITRFQSDGYTSSQLFAWEYDYEQSNATTAEDVADEVQREPRRHAVRR
jgi:triacylglycerol lipase